MSLYDLFNAAEGLLWWGVAAHLLWRVPTDEPRRRRALCAAAAIFLVFGVTDWLELGTGGRLPLWLWGLKVACGAGIFAAATNGAAGPASAGTTGKCCLEWPASLAWQSS